MCWLLFSLSSKAKRRRDSLKRRRRSLVRARGCFNPGVTNRKGVETLKAFANVVAFSQRFQRFSSFFFARPKVVAKLQPWASISQRLRRFTQTAPVLRTRISTQNAHQYSERASVLRTRTSTQNAHQYSERASVLRTRSC